MPKKSFLRRFGAQIAARDGGWFCHYCGISLIAPGTLEEPGPYEQIGGYTASVGRERPVVDHVTPQQRRFWLSTTHDLSNLVLACWLCNRRKKNKPYDRFVSEIASWCRQYDYPRKA